MQHTSWHFIPCSLGSDLIHIWLGLWRFQYPLICHLLSVAFITNENKINLSSPVLTTSGYTNVQKVRRKNSSGVGQSYLPRFLYRGFGVFCGSHYCSKSAYQPFIKVKLIFIYSLSGSKINATTSCYKLLTHDNCYFAKLCLGHPPFPLFTLKFSPNLKMKRQKSRQKSSLRPNSHCSLRSHLKRAMIFFFLHLCAWR